MHLQWTEPHTDGGSPITTYVVEKRDRFGARWTPVTRADITEPSITVTGLVEGQEYEFHVAAQNKAGVGKFSEPSRATVAKPPYGESCYIQLFFPSTGQLSVLLNCFVLYTLYWDFIFL